MSRNEQQMVSPVTTGIRQISAPGTKTPCNHLSSIVERYIRFGPFQIDRRKEVLTKDGFRISLSGKKYRILVTLLEKPGEVVSRDTICQDLWPSDIDVNRNRNFTTMINNLRRVLGDSSLSPLYIETIPRKGYVFIAHCEVSDHPDKSFASNGNQARDFHLNGLVDQASLAPEKSRFFSVHRIIGLVLIGTVLGAAVMAAWMSFHVRASASWLNLETCFLKAKASDPIAGSET